MTPSSIRALFPPWSGQRIVSGLRGDVQAGLVSAVIMIPQAVALAGLAGMPVESGVYASVLPVAVTALLGTSGRVLSGPNTAIAAMIAAAVAPLATPFSDEYVQLALLLALATGLVQVLLSFLGVGNLLAKLPASIAAGLAAGAGMTLVLTHLAMAMGVLDVRGELPWMSVFQAAAAVERANWFCIFVVLVTLVAVEGSARLTAAKPFSLVIGLVAATLACAVLDGLFGAAAVGVERLGYVEVGWPRLSVPSWNLDDWYTWQQLLNWAVAIAVVGGLQTAVIQRSLHGAARGWGSARDLLAQGLGNIVAAFSGGFAGSASFNRTSAHVEAGACTAAAAVLSAGAMLLIVWACAGALAHLPLPAVAALVMLTGWRLLASTWQEAGRAGRAHRLEMIAVALTTVLVGFLAATVLGLLAGVIRLALRGKESPAVDAGKIPADR
ncbi:SulP family inorganic anion transporter [Pseudorhodoferax sp. Leaf274]|uniref:SulP family inorganic anion transporter n=1 Tax=Pseudorhodoferax sp. Leaf274 TaxID=1736318 RepID=UPI000702C638|nr:SulP family inorganic anion transporter [Pseudorhodoferax sp. Leaf274]KQP41133.1 hypothetical protein ASF44_30275 [Pseudorhodoferax sp. Leaf274]